MLPSFFFRPVLHTAINTTIAASGAVLEQNLTHPGTPELDAITIRCELKSRRASEQWFSNDRTLLYVWIRKLSIIMMFFDDVRKTKSWRDSIRKPQTSKGTVSSY